MHPATNKVCSLLEDTVHVGAQPRAKTQQKQNLPVPPLLLLQMYFNERLRQAMER